MLMEWTTEACGRLLRACSLRVLQLYDDLNASELALHHQTLDYLAGLDRARILKAEGREATVGQWGRTQSVQSVGREAQGEASSR